MAVVNRALEQFDKVQKLNIKFFSLCRFWGC